MRLTLRTLLAYMDGILDPADHDDLDRQVEASADARDLMHRTRDTMRRVRLAAPPLLEEDGGDTPEFDANTVAEYLDNTAAPQSVVDFELQCLKSDSQLAEVASCHHILTMVLGERAKVNPETRRRMYAIPELADALAAGKAPAAPATVPSDDESLTEVPDYLRASASSPLARWLPAVAALLVFGVVSFLAFREGGWLRPAEAPMIAEGDPTPIVPPEAPSTPETGGGEEPIKEEPVEPVAGPSVATPDAPPADPVQPVEPIGSEPPVVPPTIGSEPSPLVDSTAEGFASTDPAEDDSHGAPAGGMPAAPEGGIASIDVPAPTPLAGGEPPIVPIPVPPLPTDPDPAAGMAAVDGGPETDDPEVDEGESSLPEGPLPVGLTSSPQQVLLRYNEEDGSWRRLPVRTALMTTDRLLSLPTYHPTVTLDSGLNVELVDGTQLVIGQAAPTDPPRLELVYGRLVLTNILGEPTTVVLVAGAVEAKIELSGRAVLAVESGRPFVAGADPMKQQAPLESDFYAPVGGVVWSSESGDLVVDSPGAWEIAGDSISPVESMGPEAAERSDWIDGRDLSAWESEATDEVEAQIASGRPVWPQLMEIYGSRLKEQRALSAIASSYVEHFDPFVSALGEEDLKPAWDDVIGTLRASMARGADSAAAVRETLLSLHGAERAADLYEMLCGYSDAQIGATPEQWASGPMRQLVEWLGSPHLEYRALANYNLEQITGRRRVFNPTAPPRTRESVVRRFETRLERGDLRPVFADQAR